MQASSFEGLVVNVVVSLAGKLLPILLQRGGPPADKELDRAAREFMSRAYETLASEITTNSVRVLIVLQGTGGLYLQDVQARATELQRRQEPNGKPFESDLTYRMHFLRLLGLITSVGSDILLTRMGDAFVDRAREDARRYRLAFI